MPKSLTITLPSFDPLGHWYTFDVAENGKRVASITVSFPGVDENVTIATDFHQYPEGMTNMQLITTVMSVIDDSFHREEVETYSDLFVTQDSIEISY